MLTGIVWDIWAAFALAHVPIWITFLVMFCLRRDGHPIKNSHPNIILLANIGSIGFASTSVLLPICGMSMNTYAVEAIGGSFLSIIFDSYFVLASSLYFAFNKTITQLELQSSQNSGREQSLSANIATVRKYAFFLSDRWAYIYVALNLAVYNIALLTYAIIQYQDCFSLAFDVAFVQTNFVYLQGVTTAKTCTANILLCIVAFQIRLIKDAIGIKKLLKRSAVVCLTVFMIFWCLAGLIVFGVIDSTVWAILVAVLGADVVFVISIVIPVMKSNQAIGAVIPVGKLSLLDEFLKLPQGYAAFRQHLEKEFAVENILFWHDAKEFSDRFATSDDNLEKAVRMYNLYIQKDAPFAVNLDSNNFRHYRDIFSKIYARNPNLMGPVQSNNRAHLTRIDSMSRVQQTIAVIPTSPEEGGPVPLPSDYLTGNLFDRASKQLLQLMQSDSLPRFLANDANNNLWQDYITGLKEQAVHDLVRDGSETDMHVLLETSLRAN